MLLSHKKLIIFVNIYSTIKFNNFKNTAMSQGTNFDDAKKQLLIDLITENKIIENKKTDSDTTTLKKTCMEQFSWGI